MEIEEPTNRRNVILRLDSTNLNLPKLHYYRIKVGSANDDDKVYLSDFQYNAGPLELDFDLELTEDSTNKIRIEIMKHRLLPDKLISYTEVSVCDIFHSRIYRKAFPLHCLIRKQADDPKFLIISVFGISTSHVDLTELLCHRLSKLEDSPPDQNSIVELLNLGKQVDIKLIKPLWKKFVQLMFEAKRTKKENVAVDTSSVCKICLDELNVSNPTYTLKCNHRYCENCLKEMVGVKIRDNEILMIKCPDPTCSYMLDFEDIEALSGNCDDNFISNMTKALVISYQCKVCSKCQGLMEHNILKYRPRLVCSQCTYSSCKYCLSDWHEGKMCDEMIEAFEQIFNIKKCPQCHIRIEKYDGCNHITCKACNHEFCWLCLDPYTHDHFTSGTCQDKLFYIDPEEQPQIRVLSTLTKKKAKYEKDPKYNFMSMRDRLKLQKQHLEKRLGANTVAVTSLPILVPGVAIGFTGVCMILGGIKIFQSTSGVNPFIRVPARIASVPIFLGGVVVTVASLPFVLLPIYAMKKILE